MKFGEHDQNGFTDTTVVVVFGPDGVIALTNLNLVFGTCDCCGQYSSRQYDEFPILKVFDAVTGEVSYLMDQPWSK